MPRRPGVKIDFVGRASLVSWCGRASMRSTATRTSNCNTVIDRNSQQSCLIINKLLTKNWSKAARSKPNNNRIIVRSIFLNDTAPGRLAIQSAPVTSFSACPRVHAFDFADLIVSRPQTRQFLAIPGDRAIDGWRHCPNRNSRIPSRSCEFSQTS